MNLRNFALLFHTVILSHVLLAVSVNEKPQGHSTSGGGGLRIPDSYKPKYCSSDSESDDCNIEFNCNIEFDEESSSDESMTRRIPLRQTKHLRSMRDLSVKHERSAHAARKATGNAAKRVIRKPTPAHIQNLRNILADKDLCVSKKTSKPVTTSGLGRRRVNLVNAVRYLLQPVLEVTNVGSTRDEVDLHSLAELARTNLLDFQESREKRRHIDLSVISDWVYEKIPDNNQFAYSPNFEGIISLINTGKWVNRQGPDEPSQTPEAISIRRQVAECSLTAFLKPTHESLTGNDSLALEKVKRQLQNIAGNKRYNNPLVIRKWCEGHIPTISQNR